MDAKILADAHRWWFGPLADAGTYPADKAPLWFTRKDETDAAIRERFGAHLPAVAAERWDLAALTREEAMGLVVFLDQFPRNLFRDGAEAFAYDARARQVADRLIADRHADFFPIERSFLYLPFEHSEAPADQERGVALFRRLLADAPAGQEETYRNFVKYAEIHRDLIARFGRFPHRNAVLGRASTPQESLFLRQHGRGY